MAHRFIRRWHLPITWTCDRGRPMTQARLHAQTSTHQHGGLHAQLARGHDDHQLRALRIKVLSGAGCIIHCSGAYCWGLISCKYDMRSTCARHTPHLCVFSEACKQESKARCVGLLGARPLWHVSCLLLIALHHKHGRWHAPAGHREGSPAGSPGAPAAAAGTPASCRSPCPPGSPRPRRRAAPLPRAAAPLHAH